MQDSLQSLFTWRTAIIHSDLPATTRHVLLTLSLHMNEVGGSCFPSTKTLAKETGLSERAVCTHLEKAKTLDWLKKKPRKKGNQWSSTEYFAHIPTEFKENIRTERGSAPSDSGTEGGSVHGTEPDDKPVLNEVQSNSTTTNSSSLNSSGNEPDLFPEDQRFVYRKSVSIPKNLMLNTPMRQHADKHGLTGNDLDYQFEKFSAHHEAKGSTFKNWEAAWRTWVLNWKKFSAQDVRKSDQQTGRHSALPRLN